LLTATGPLIDLANSQSLTFGALRGERDREYQFGVAIPFHGWVLDEDAFQTTARNCHSNISESNLFWPLTWDRALIQGWETMLRSRRCGAGRSFTRPTPIRSRKPRRRSLHRRVDLSDACADGMPARRARQIARTRTSWKPPALHIEDQF
jgi:hypothetical protein